MKSICSGLISLVATVSFAANVPDFRNQFLKFQINNNVEMTWAATNHLRDILWTYKVVPQHYPSSTILRLIAMGQFTVQDEKNGNREISDTNENTLFFYSKERLCNLSVVPVQGTIDHWNGHALAYHWGKTNHLWEKVDGVPNDKDAEKLGLKCLKQLGIKRSDLAQKANGVLLKFGEKKTRGCFDRRTQKDVEDEVTARGVFFIRRLDGVDFAGIGNGGGCEIEFGNHAKISEFKLNWPNLQPFEEYDVASQNELIQFIQDGNAVMTHKNLVNPAEIKSLTITDVAPFYWGTSADEPQSFVYPFAQVNATANLGYTNEDIQLYCPILDKQIITISAQTNRLN